MWLCMLRGAAWRLHLATGDQQETIYWLLDRVNVVHDPAYFDERGCQKVPRYHITRGTNSLYCLSHIQKIIDDMEHELIHYSQ